MNRWRRFLLAIPALAAIGTFGWWTLHAPAGAERKKTSVAPPVPVVLAEARTETQPLILELPGRAEAYESVTLKARIDGQVLSVGFTEGQQVRRGDILLQLDPADVRARLQQAEANLAKSQAQAAKTRADLARYRELRGKGFVSEEKLADLRTAAEAAEAAIRADQANTDLARLQLDYTTVRAPFTGKIGARQVYPGSTVKANDTALAVLNRIQPLMVAFALPERHLSSLKAAMAGTGGTQVNLRQPGGTTVIATGPVFFIDNAIDPATGTIQVKARIENRDGALTAGQFVNVALQLGMLEKAIVIPAEAIQQGIEGPMVFVVKNEIAEPRKVKIVAVQQGRALLGAGVAAGEQVVVEGHLRLSPGARVKPSGNGKTPA